MKVPLLYGERYLENLEMDLCIASISDTTISKETYLLYLEIVHLIESQACGGYHQPWYLGSWDYRLIARRKF